MSSLDGIDPFTFDVVVIGSGFSGCYLLHILRKHGFRIRVLEWNKQIGGVWAWNVLRLPYFQKTLAVG